MLPNIGNNSIIVKITREYFNISNLASRFLVDSRAKGCLESTVLCQKGERWDAERRPRSSLAGDISLISN